MFSGYFRMNPECETCQARFERGQGFYLGSIYFNYGLTALLVTAGYLAMFLLTSWSEPVKLGILGAFTLLFPLWFFRYARCLWYGMDHLFDPDSDADRDNRALHQ